jgi:ABC-type polysaccharide/polyol phosphate transport system ATPase subunit
MLQLSAVAKTYPGGVRALHDVSLDIPKGLFGLIGPNGAGKSTLMRTIAAGAIERRACACGTAGLRNNKSSPIAEFVVDVTELEPLYLEHHRLRSGSQQITVRVAEKPGLVGVDPFHLMIDRRRSDNLLGLPAAAPMGSAP